MVRFFVLALLLLGGAVPARATDAASAAALARVRASEAEMREARMRANAAATKKDSAAKRAMDAVHKLNNLPGWRIISKAIAGDKAENAKASFVNARREHDRAEGDFVEDGTAYLKAENSYHQATGNYYNEQQYAAIKEQIHYASMEAAQDKPVESQRAVEEAQNVQAKLLSGKMGMGEMAAKANSLAHMGDDLVAQTLDKKFLSGTGAAPATNPSNWTASSNAGPAAAASSSVGYGRGNPPPDALNMDKAILLSAPVGETRQSAGRRYVTAGKESLAKGDAGGALRAAEAAIKDNPRDSKAWAMKAAALNKLRRFQDAEQAAQTAVALDRTNAQAYRDLAWAQLHNGKASEAEASATRMIFLDPENAEGFLLRAFAHELKNDRAEMLADLERAAALDPRYLNHLARARAGLRLFDPSSSDTDSLLNALSLPPVRRANPVTIIGVALLLLAAATFVARVIPLSVARWRQGGAGRTVNTAPRPPRATEPIAAASDDLLAGKYKLKRIAGRGGMGQVWQALDTSLDRRVAIKEMAPELAGDPALRELYVKEARTIANLHHPNIVEIYEILDLQPNLYLVFEWVSGKTLAHVLAEKKVLPLETARAVLGPVCEALAFAHDHGVVHRDLKPANVMVSAAAHVKLMDFGVARALGDNPRPTGGHAATPAPSPFSATRTRTVAGTPGYRPPDAEQGIVTPAFDLFCLGICLYEMLSGELPFGPEGWAPERAAYTPLSKKIPGLSEALDDLLVRALEPDPAKRLSDARAFKGALERV